MRQGNEGQRQRGVTNRRAENRHQHQCQQQTWQRQHDIDHAHDNVINQAAEVTGDQAENNAHNQRQHHHQTANQQR
ncbi:Uncharacterised protein [Shigella flexneri]|nr:Uncharacterised protein [Shigella flexneri]